MNLSQAIQDLFNDILDVARIVAPIAAVIEFIGIGLVRRAAYVRSPD